MRACGDTLEIFAEGYRGAIVRAGVVKLRLVSNRLSTDTDQPKLEQVATLTMPIVDFLDVVGALNRLADEIRSGSTVGATQEPKE